MFNKRRKIIEPIKEIAQESKKQIEQEMMDVNEHCRNLDQTVAKCAMKMRQYDALMEMDYGDDYIDPVTGQINPYIEFERNRDIYSEHLKDTGSLFDND